MSTTETDKTEVQGGNTNNTNFSLIPNLITPAMPLLTQIYGDLASPSIKKVGQALETVLDFGYTFLAMPLQNASEKKKLNYKKNMDMYKKKIEQIEEEDIAEVSPEIGVPILQKLTYVKNDDIAELFTSLLASASSINTCSLVHPGFINVIENLSVDEARILQHISPKNTVFPFIYLDAIFNNGGRVIVKDYLTNFENEISLLFPENIPLYFANLVSQGLLLIDHNQFLAKVSYDYLIENYKPLIEHEKKWRKDVPTRPDNLEFEKLIVNKGCCELTSFAESFLKVCVK